MPETKQTVAVLFADICGSTALFEETGNLKALDLIGECLDSLAAVARECGGTVIRSKGDDVLCTFADPSEALRGARQMTEKSLEGSLQIHVAIHYGPVINARDDIFGDVVNVASRLLDLANPGEILVSEDFSSTLAKGERGAMRLLEQRLVKGKSDPMGIYSVFTQDPESTQFYLDTGERTIAPTQSRVQLPARAKLTLTFQNRTFVRDQTDAALILGRSERCDLVVGEPCVSREHAAIRIEHGKAMLTDRSSTGTYIQAPGERAVLVKRETVPLIGSGALSLGREPNHDDAHLIQFQQSFEG